MRHCLINCPCGHRTTGEGVDDTHYRYYYGPHGSSFRYECLECDRERSERRIKRVQLIRRLRRSAGYQRHWERLHRTGSRNRTLVR